MFEHEPKHHNSTQMDASDVNCSRSNKLSNSEATVSVVEKAICASIADKLLREIERVGLNEFSFRVNLVQKYVLAENFGGRMRS